MIFMKKNNISNTNLLLKKQQSLLVAVIQIVFDFLREFNEPLPEIQEERVQLKPVSCLRKLIVRLPNPLHNHKLLGFARIFLCKA